MKIGTKFNMAAGIIILLGSYYLFLSNGSPLTLILSMFGALLVLDGIFGDVNHPDNFYYIGMLSVTIYF